MYKCMHLLTSQSHTLEKNSAALAVIFKIVLSCGFVQKNYFQLNCFYTALKSISLLGIHRSLFPQIYVASCTNPTPSPTIDQSILTISCTLKPSK